MEKVEEAGSVNNKDLVLTLDEAWIVRSELQKRDERCMSKEEVACLLNRPLAQGEDLIDCLVENLPVISVKRSNQSRIYEASEFLRNPEMMIRLWNFHDEALAESTNCEEIEPNVIRPTRKAGSGLNQENRRKISAEMAKEVENFIAYAGSGLGAHARRRTDRGHFGGQGAGVTWKGHVYPFVKKHFFNDDSSQISFHTVRRLALPPKPGTHASILYRGIIRAKPASALNNQTLGKAHANAHYCSAMVNYAMEFSALHAEHYCSFWG